MVCAFIEAGAKAVAILDANRENGVTAVAELRQALKSKIPIDFFALDIRDADAVNKAVQTIVGRYGAPDILINSAGIAE